MAISDIIFDTIGDIIDGVAGYYDNNDMLEILDHEGVVEVVAVHLKIVDKAGYHRPTEADLARINAVNWEEEAKKFIENYLREHYLD